jgi:hypothetical protein
MSETITQYTYKHCDPTIAQKYIKEEYDCSGNEDIANQANQLKA